VAELDRVIRDLNQIHDELRAAIGSRFPELDARLVELIRALGRDPRRNARYEVRSLLSEYLPEGVLGGILLATATLSGDVGPKTGPSTGAVPIIPPSAPRVTPVAERPDRAEAGAAYAPPPPVQPPASIGPSVGDVARPSAAQPGASPYPQAAPTPSRGRGWSVPDIFSRSRAPKPAKRPLPPQSRDSTYAVIPVWYATDRNHVPGAPPSRRYGAEFSIIDDRPVVNYGTVNVSIPRTHVIGRLESPHWYRLEFEPDPERHVVVQEVVELDEEEWLRSIRTRVRAGDEVGAVEPTDTSHDLLVFIHGYLTTWADAARRAAQFAWDLEFQGVPVLYSWPSRGELLSYPADESASAWSAPHFTAVLKRLLADSGARRVHLVAHSMGNRISTDALRVLALEKTRYPTPVREVVFAAPDIDRHTFQEFVTAFNAAVADFEAPRMPRLTLYACGMDSALDLSRRVHRLNRAGDSRKGIVVALPMDTIEVAKRVIRTESRDAIGHSYFCSNRVVIHDLIGVVLDGRDAVARSGLTPKRTRAGPYWRLDGSGDGAVMTPTRARPVP
jgi:esterase/lipase superfamily enzyme